MIEELDVISGKGGTGKTSVTAAFAVLAGRCVTADCDVDGPDLHLVLSPQIKKTHEFRSGHEAAIREKDCIACGACLAHCRFEAVRMDGRGAGDAIFSLDPLSCEGCGVCMRMCPVQAIDFPERVCGEWMFSTTRCGPMVHARLGIAAENSGKLVSTVRRESRRVAERDSCSLIIVDGPPVLGCPVIASLTGATRALIVIEPTVSGWHGTERVLSLARHFGIPTAVCVNKWDLNPEMTQQIERGAQQAGARVVGRIRCDSAVSRAQIQQLAVVEIDSLASQDLCAVWERLNGKRKA